MRISDWSSDVCSSDLLKGCIAGRAAAAACGRRASPTPGSPTRHATPEAMVYAVKEIFLTLQGEGAQAGRRAVFCRFAGCNLWTGREKDRAKAVCQFCDTDFVGRSEEHTSELQSLMRISYDVFCLKKKKKVKHTYITMCDRTNEQTI